MAVPPQVLGVPPKPAAARVHAFFDGQNLFHRAKRCFSYEFPNYDPVRLAEEVVAAIPEPRTLTQVHFYTGIHDAGQNRFWHEFWNRKLTALRGRGVRVVSRSLIYASIDTPDGPVTRGFEKGIDLQIGLDLVRLARKNEYDVALIFSQDTDLMAAVEEVKELRKELNRWIILESAFPSNPGLGLQRGIPGTQWRPFEKVLYDRCIDPADYRPPREKPSSL